MTIDETVPSPRWGEVSHCGEYTNPEKPARTLISGGDDPAGWSDFPQNDSGTCGKSGTPLTQSPGGMFPSRSLVDALLARAFAHSPEAARRARLVAVAIDQWPNKTPLDQPRELAKIDQDVSALSEMMGVRS